MPFLKVRQMGTRMSSSETETRKVVLLAGQVSWQAEVAKLVERGLVAEWRPGGDWQTYMGRLYYTIYLHHITLNTIISYKYTFGLYKFVCIHGMEPWPWAGMWARLTSSQLFCTSLEHV